MSVSKQLDFTEGPILKKMILFSWPIFLTNLLQSSYQLIDSIWVGNLLGANALGAITISATVVFTILSFIIGLNGATLTVISQRRGAKDEQGLKESLNAFVFVLGTLALLLGLLGYVFSGSILRFMGTPGEILPLAQSYLQINFIGILFLFGYNFIGTVLRALGDSKTPIQFIVIAVLLNAILDPLFIYVLQLGIDGAAYATVLSQGIAFVYGLLYSIYKAKVPFQIPYLPEKSYFIVLFKLGLPAGLSMMAISAGILAIMTVVTSFGEEVVAGFGAAQRLDSLIMLPALTLGSAVNSMAGQNIGAKLWERVNEIAQKAIILIIIVSVLISTIIFFGAERFIKIFIQDPETVQFGVTYVKTIAFFYPFLGINFVLNGIVRAAGAMFPILVLNIISFWILRYPLTAIFAKWLGEQGIALGMGLSFVISSVIATAYYFRGNWRKISEDIAEKTRSKEKS
ncbi:MATE family efflux transporter [Halalkalibacter akibai]|uniref:Na+ driven multidrug efflux pump n=1 Tax=Halalkalibacter akibai (strain ATCC 43226 / DSM 21942 / CIP 109018 / JCM 9157 / 1139) TaxID=1236973 RepID=W4QWG6_HALA3|nr:MATE family efflux transporter [Halalkalibacter akibai]GAE36421.1 Na+ driven multidrug efflux pump [Halalkalibacter akibai JCM 9157]